MKISMNKRLFLIGTTIFLLAFCFVSPRVSAYGTTIGTAEIITDGTYGKTLLSADSNGYYKIYCSSSQSLRVTISYSYPTYDLDLYLYNPSQSQVDSSTSSSSTDTVSYGPTTSGYYYIRVYRYTGTGDAGFILTITLTAFIPGFDILFVVYGLLMILGLVLTLRYQKFVFPLK